MTPVLHDHRGFIHCHSIHSYDGTTPVEEILEAAKKRGIDYVVLTDHSTLAARPMEGWHGSVLLVVGQEISPRFNHYLAFGIDRPIIVAEESEDPQPYIDEVRHRGGFGIIAHPDHGGTEMFHVKHFPWKQWAVSGFAGMGVWDFMTDWQSSLTSFPRAMAHYLFPAHVLRGPKRETLQRWDSLNRTERIIGIGELDNHNTRYDIAGLRLRIFPFERAFRLVGTHILTEAPLPDDGTEAASALLGALRRGRAYMALEYFHPARGFAFFIRDGEGSATMGDDFPLQKEAVITVRTPCPSDIRIVRDGRPFHRCSGSEVSVPVTEAGLYRVEVYLKTWLKLRPWIFSNPLSVTSS